MVGRLERGEDWGGGDELEGGGRMDWQKAAWADLLEGVSEWNK